jgi:hypothetical protein
MLTHLTDDMPIKRLKTMLFKKAVKFNLLKFNLRQCVNDMQTINLIAIMQRKLKQS